MPSSPIPPRVLILYAHPAPHRSRINRQLVAAVRELPGVTLHDLYERYPEFEIDVGHEQQLLAEHDAIVFQHPFYWYSTPAILKEWQDLVLQHGWAYGTGGDALAGKRFMSAITTGARATSYRREGSNRFTVRELLAPLEQTARLCGMKFLTPFVVNGAHSLSANEAARHAEEYRRAIESVRDQETPAHSKAGS